MNEYLIFFKKVSLLVILLFLPVLLSAQNVDHYLNQGKIHYELEEYEMAIDNFRSVLDFPQFPKEVYQYLTSSYLLNEEPEQAVKIASEGLDEYPEYLRLKVMKGEAYIQFNRQSAINVFEQVILELENADKSAIEGIRTETVQEYVGRLYQQKAAEAFENGDLTKAADAFKSARSYQPGELSIHNNLAYILIQNEQWDEAEQAVEEGLSHFPESESLLFMRAQVLENRGDSDQLIDALEQLYLTDPDNMERAVLYGTALLNNNRADEANLFFQQKINEHPKERILYRTLIDINRQRHNQSGLLEVYSLKLDNFPDDKDLLEEYGTELITAQEFSEAYTYFDSLSVEFNSPEFARQAAWALLYEEDYEKAEIAYETYVSNWPEAINLKADFGLTLKKNNKPEAAAEILETFLRYSSSDWIRIQYVQLLSDKERIHEELELLYNTEYEGLAKYLTLKRSRPDSNDNSEYFYSEILMDIIDLYRIKQEEVQQEAQRGLQDLRAPYPPLLQTSRELTFISSELHNMLSFVTENYSFQFSISVLDLAMEEYPNSALLNQHKGKQYYYDSSIEKAKTYFENAARLSPDNKETHLYLGHIYSEINDFNKASISYERVLSIDSTYREAYQLLIRESQRHGKLDLLCERWLQRYRNNKENELLQDFLIDALHRADRFEEAREIAEE